jgi:hypothetical protein
MKGTINYSNAWGHFMNACASWGVSPPQDGNIVAVDAALLMQVYRYKKNKDDGRPNVYIAPSSSSDINVQGPQPVRHPGLPGAHGETWFDAPRPNTWRTAFNFAQSNALLEWMKVWMGLNRTYGYNGMTVHDMSAAPDKDGTSYVNLAGGYGNGDPGCPWVVRILVRFSYVHRAYAAPAWSGF